VRFCVDHDVRPEVDAVMRLDEAPAAVGRMASGDVRGKIVLKP